MMYTKLLMVIFILITGCNLNQNKDVAAQNNDRLPECEWCGANEAPKNISWQAVIPPKDEIGEPLIIKGIVYNPDKSPASNVLIYMYHTNNKGIYPKKGNETGNGRRHGYLRGWVLTNNNGEYLIKTIKPAPYPNGTEPAHIHITIKEKDKEEYWIDSIVFEDDPFVDTDYKERISNLGGSGIVKLTKDDAGNWVAARDIILK